MDGSCGWKYVDKRYEGLQRIESYGGTWSDTADKRMWNVLTKCH